MLNYVITLSILLFINSKIYENKITISDDLSTIIRIYENSENNNSIKLRILNQTIEILSDDINIIYSSLLKGEEIIYINKYLIAKDFDGDKINEIVLNFNDPFFGNKSRIRIYRFKNNKLFPLEFYYKSDNKMIKFGHEIISMNKECLITYDNKIYIISSIRYVLDKHDNNIKVNKIYKFEWNKALNGFLLTGQKLMENENLNNIKDFIF